MNGGFFRGTDSKVLFVAFVFGLDVLGDSAVVLGCDVFNDFSEGTFAFVPVVLWNGIGFVSGVVEIDGLFHILSDNDSNFVVFCLHFLLFMLVFSAENGLIVFYGFNFLNLQVSDNFFESWDLFKKTLLLFCELGFYFLQTVDVRLNKILLFSLVLGFFGLFLALVGIHTILTWERVYIVDLACL